MASVFAVGIGPGSPQYLTDIVKETVSSADIVIGYKYTLGVLQDIISEQRQEVFEITMKNQEEVYQRVSSSLGNKTCVVPFTGDVNFSESEVVDRLIEIFGDVTLISGISSIQVAASRARVPLDRSRVITFHVTTAIEEKKIELVKSIIDGYSTIVVPRPWPNDPEKNFMPKEIACYLKNKGVDTQQLNAYVFEHLTTEKEQCFKGRVSELEDKEFSDMSVMVIDQHVLNSYKNLKE